MKKIGEYTTRGSITSGTDLHRIILDDGSFETGYRVVEFRVGAHDMDLTSNRTFSGKLLTDDDTTTGINWNWESNQEIAWACMGYDSNGNAAPNEFTLVDPDNMVIQDLFLIIAEGAGYNVNCNYFIRLEKYQISDWQGALSMVRNRSQA